MDNLYQSDVPILINITLFKNNYIDQKLISLIRQKSLYYREDGPNKFTISTWDMNTIIQENLSDILNDVKSATPMEFPNKVNSIFFINELIASYPNLRYLTINISEDKNYSRLIYSKGENNQDIPIINFDFKVIHSILDFPAHLESDELTQLNQFLKDTNLINEDLYRQGPPYIHTNINELRIKIDMFVETNGEESPYVQSYLNILELIAVLITPKIESDNPTCLLITDYPN